MTASGSGRSNTREKPRRRKGYPAHHIHHAFPGLGMAVRAVILTLLSSGLILILVSLSIPSHLCHNMLEACKFDLFIYFFITGVQH